MRQIAIVVACVAVTWAAEARAQAVPETMAFSGRLSDAVGPLDGNVNLRFRLFPGPSGGTAVWDEDHASVLASEGLVTIALGSIVSLDETVFDGSALYLDIAVNGTSLSPRAAVHAVPYAYRSAVAATAETLGGIGAGDLQRRVTGTCSGQVLTAIAADGSVTCEPDNDSGGDIAGVTAGPGLTGGGTTGTVTVAADFNAVQARVASQCAAGSSIRSIAASGAVTCQADGNSGGDITSVLPAAGSGLTGGGTAGAVTIGVDSSVLQARIGGMCAAGQAIRAVSAAGIVTCEADNDTTYTAGSGLDMVGTTLSVDPTELNGSSPAVRAAATTSIAITGTGFVTVESVTINAPASAGGRIVVIGTARISDVTPMSGGVVGDIGLDTNEADTPPAVTSYGVQDAAFAHPTVTSVFSVAAGSSTTIFMRVNSDTSESVVVASASVMAWFIPN